MKTTPNGMNSEAQLQKRFGNIILRAVLVTGLVLLLPLMAMQFTPEVNWTGFDFAVAGALLLGTGVAYAIATRKIRAKSQRLMIAAGMLAVFFAIWVELAVGIFH